MAEKQIFPVASKPVTALEKVRYPHEGTVPLCSIGSHTGNGEGVRYWEGREADLRNPETVFPKRRE